MSDNKNSNCYYYLRYRLKLSIFRNGSRNTCFRSVIHTSYILLLISTGPLVDSTYILIVFFMSPKAHVRPSELYYVSGVRTRVQKVKPKIPLRCLKAVNSPAIVNKTTKLNIYHLWLHSKGQMTGFFTPNRL